MKIFGKELEEYPEFYQSLCKVCEITSGDLLYNTHAEVDFITDEGDWRGGIKAYSIKYRLVYLPIKLGSSVPERIEYKYSCYKSCVIDNNNWPRFYKMIDSEVKMFLRDNKLNELGI